MTLKFSVGISNFGELIEKNLHFVDKTGLIIELLNRSEATTLITRPRRFGKTLNLSMLQHFLASKVFDRATNSLFTGLKIEQSPLFAQHQGQYPVIFFNFQRD